MTENYDIATLGYDADEFQDEMKSRKAYADDYTPELEFSTVHTAFILAQLDRIATALEKIAEGRC